MALNTTESFIYYNPDLKKPLGISGALLIGYLVYSENTTRPSYNGKEWIGITGEELAIKVGRSLRTIERTVRKLKRMGLLSVEKLSEHKSNRTNYYAVNLELLNELLAQEGGSHG